MGSWPVCGRHTLPALPLACDRLWPAGLRHRVHSCAHTHRAGQHLARLVDCGEVGGGRERRGWVCMLGCLGGRWQSQKKANAGRAGIALACRVVQPGAQAAC